MFTAQKILSSPVSLFWFYSLIVYGTYTYLLCSCTIVLTFSVQTNLKSNS